MDGKRGKDSALRTIKIQVKTEPPDEDIQEYAEDTMNELLAIYGYEEKVEHGVTQTMQLGDKYTNGGETALRKKVLMARCNRGEAAASDSSVSGNVTPVSGSDPQSAEEGPASPSSSQDTLDIPEAVREESPNDKDQIVCAWCKSPGMKHYTLNTQAESKAFCSERCFAACRRAYFKRNKVCDWCRHTRHLQEYLFLNDRDQRLQFCSSKCMNQYKMDVYCRENRKISGKVYRDGSGSNGNGSVPATRSPTLQQQQQQSTSSRSSPDTASQNASLHNSQPSPSNIPLSGVFQTHSNSSQSMMGMSQLRPSGVFGVQTVVPQPVSFRQMVPQMPVVQVVGAGGVPMNLVQGLSQTPVSSSSSHKSSSRSQQQMSIPGYQSGSSLKKIRPKPQSSSTAASRTETASCSNAPSNSSSSVHRSSHSSSHSNSHLGSPNTSHGRSHGRSHGSSHSSSHQSSHKHTPSTSAAGGGTGLHVPPVTVMVPHPVFVPFPVPIPIPIPVCKEVYEAAMKEVRESKEQQESQSEVEQREERPHKKRNVDVFAHGSSHLPSTSSTGAFVPYRSHMDMQEDVTNSTEGHSMDTMLSSSLQHSLSIPQSSASEALESRLKLQAHRHPTHISTATVEAVHRSINSRINQRHKCLQRSASMDLSVSRYNTLSAITDFLGERHGFNPMMQGAHLRRDHPSDVHSLHSRGHQTGLPTKGAGELSPSVREALRCHLTRRLSQSALNLTDVGRYPEEDQLRRSQSLSRLVEDSEGSHHHDMDAISSHTSLEKLADTSDSSELVDSRSGSGREKLDFEEAEMQPVTKKRCLGSPNQID